MKGFFNSFRKRKPEKTDQGEKSDLSEGPSEQTQISIIQTQIRSLENWKYYLTDYPLKEKAITDIATTKGFDIQLVRQAFAELYAHTLQKFDATKRVTNKYVVFVDGIVPRELRNDLESHLDKLATDLSANFNKVNDLIQPSLYPYIKDDSYVLERKRERDTHDEILDYWGRRIESSKYQWLPSVFSVDDNNKVKINSYINNLNPNKYPEIYQDAENLFETMLPHIERCMFYAKDNYNTKNNTKAFSPPKGPREYQVIVKVTNYELAPGAHFTGNWHVEGMSHEHILVSCIYYYSSSPHLEDFGLSFRVDQNGMEPAHFGSVLTVENRAVIFSNQFQHCVQLLKNLSQSEPAIRKIFCFFVIDPARPIISTQDVPYQQWDHRRKRLILVMLWVFKSTGIYVPKEIVLKIVNMAKLGFTREEAEKHMEELTTERRQYVDDLNMLMERDYDLCTGTDDDFP